MRCTSCFATALYAVPEHKRRRWIAVCPVHIIDGDEFIHIDRGRLTTELSYILVERATRSLLAYDTRPLTC